MLTLLLELASLPKAWEMSRERWNNGRGEKQSCRCLPKEQKATDDCQRVKGSISRKRDRVMKEGRRWILLSNRRLLFCVLGQTMSSAWNRRYCHKGRVKRWSSRHDCGNGFDDRSFGCILRVRFVLCHAEMSSDVAWGWANILRQRLRRVSSRDCEQMSDHIQMGISSMSRFPYLPSLRPTSPIHYFCIRRFEWEITQNVRHAVIPEKFPVCNLNFRSFQPTIVIFKPGIDYDHLTWKLCWKSASCSEGRLRTNEFFVSMTWPGPGRWGIFRAPR
jgi:hypothetical protein